MCGNHSSQGERQPAVNGNSSSARDCWDFWQCGEEQKEECRVYRKKLGRTCWYVPLAFRAETARDFNSCWECSWYRTVNTIE
jgi:hypothetical protein